ncbi:MAG: hypothetical protein SFU86_04620 [Pirellulaceae bacterium]|nr:hypothetical protein [Pirellulaceae bacterium]
MLTPRQLHEALAHYRRSLARYWRLSLGAFCAVLLVTAVGLMLMPRTYQSEARLFVRFGRENNLDPTATTGQVVTVNETRESELNSLLEVLKSRAILDKLVDSLGPDFILSGRVDPVRAQSAERPPAERLAEPQMVQPSRAHQQAISSLEKMLEIFVPRKSNIIMVSCQGRSPEQAQTIVNRLVEIYLDEHVRVHQTPGSYEFFAEQTSRSKEQWENASEKLRAEKNRLGIVTLDGKRLQLQAELADNETKQLANQAELSASEAKIASLEALIAKLPATVVTQQSQAQNMAFDNMRGTLFNLESREQELAAKMNPNHPQLIAIREQIAELRRTITEQPQQRVHATEAVNPARQSLELALLTERSQADGLRGRADSLVALRGRLQADLESLNANETAFALLQQEVDQAESRHVAYAEKLEQARLNRSLDEERISSLSLVQPASYAAKPSGPRRLYVLAAGLLLALMTAAGLPLAGTWLNPTLESAAELAQLLELPLVGNLPARPALAA